MAQHMFQSRLDTDPAEAEQRIRPTARGVRGRAHPRRIQRRAGCVVRDLGRHRGPTRPHLLLVVEDFRRAFDTATGWRPPGASDAHPDNRRGTRRSS
jgi:hypothetical protein